MACKGEKKIDIEMLTEKLWSGGHESGATNVGECVLGGGPSGMPLMMLRLLSENRLSCSSSVQTGPTLTLQKSDKGLVSMHHGTARRVLTFLWLRFKEFESLCTPFTYDTLLKSSTPGQGGSYAARQTPKLTQTLKVSHQTWINVFLSSANKIQDTAWGVFSGS